MKKFLSLCLVLITCVALVACSAGSNYEAGDMPSAENGKIVNDSLNRKIVYNVSLSFEADNVSELKNSISERSEALGGYIESNSESYDDGECIYTSVVYRIPTEKLDEFINCVEKYADVESKIVNTTDITTSYVSAQAQKNALLERKELLEEMLGDESISASDRITIINEISEASASLQAIELEINGYDTDVSYSTVTIYIDEKISLMAVFVPIIIIAAIIAAVVITHVLIKRKHKKKASNS